jgi:hypothetical protein
MRKRMMKSRLWWRIVPLLIVAAGVPTSAWAEIRVDLNPDNGRSDVLTREWENWPVRDGAASQSRQFGGVTVTLRKAGSVGDALTGGWWKPGLDYAARMASDGAYVKGGERGGQMEVVISGLAPGRHGIATFHNSLWDGPVSRYNVYVDGVLKVTGVAPSTKVKDDYDAAAAFVEVEAQAGKDVTLRFEPDGSGRVDNVVLNGLVIDTVDPARRARKPVPAHGDEYVERDAVLTWTAAETARAHRVYLGSDYESVARATAASAEFKGERASIGFPTAGLGLSHWGTYYWRVDEVGADGVTAGEVWRFRVRRLAFPGAEGYGRFAAGGRGGRVILVTSLE